jgi:adenine phosphoribosyltransferase
MKGELGEELKRAVRKVPDYPMKGIMFRDLTTIWKDGTLTRRVIDSLYEHCKDKKVDKVVGIEARGFIVGAPLADRLGVGFVPARKSGKLPSEKLTVNYDLEYGKQGLEIHRDSVDKGERVVIVDDLLATGGTSAAARRLVEELGGKVVGFLFVVELSYLHGREKLAGYDVDSLVCDEAE